MKKKMTEHTRQLVFNMHNCFCCVDDCYELAIEIHHRNSNSEMNNKLYPLLMQSVFMLVPICRKHHEDGKVLKSLRYTDNQMFAFELYLQEVITNAKKK